VNSVEGQPLIFAQIDGHAIDGRPELQGRGGLGREGGPVDAAARSGFDLGLMLGDLHLRFGQIVDRAALDAVGALPGRGATAARTAFDAMGHDPVGLLDQAQRMPSMARPVVRGPVAFLAQALGLGFGESFGRGWLVTLVAVFGDSLFQRPNPPAQGMACDAHGGVSGFQDGDFFSQQVRFARHIAEHSRLGFGIGPADRESSRRPSRRAADLARSLRLPRPKTTTMRRGSSAPPKSFLLLTHAGGGGS
jgi:hypothetical protein